MTAAHGQRQAGHRPLLLRNVINRHGVRVLGILPLVILLGALQTLGDPASPYLPPPTSWWVAIMDLIDAGRLTTGLLATASTFVIALLVAIAIGSLIGLAIGSSRRFDRLTGPLVEFSRAMPPPAIVPVAILLIGFGRSMAVPVVVFTAMWPIVLNTATAVRSIHPVLSDAARTVNLPVTTRVRKVLFPALLPGLLVGLRVAAPLCIIVTLLVEMLSASGGIGALLIEAQRSYLSARAYGLLVVVGLMGFAVNTGVVAIERSVLQAWPPRAQGG